MPPEWLAPTERMFAILTWSALPGASRNHWGTDIDVFDRASVPPGAAPELRRAESMAGAAFGPLHRWLDANLQRFGFFGPYDQDRGGVSPEPWHLSYAPIAKRLQAVHSAELLERVIRAADIELKVEVLRHLPHIFETYVMNVGTPGGTKGSGGA
jgi:LAS superfamily LD-carboxypeptidase LdcB